MTLCIKGRSEIRIVNFDDKKLVGYAALSDKSPLSNSFRKCFYFAGKKWYYAFNALMYMKAICFNEPEVAEKIVYAECPAEAQELTDNLREYDADLWRVYQQNQLNEILSEKFKVPILKDWLASTGDAVLTYLFYPETSGNKIWGICIDPQNTDFLKPETWINYGENLIGNIVMCIRNK
jgi:ribA/ribD-fused uncharacterized protein